MKAVVWTKYGSPDGLLLKEVEKPTPKDNQVLIKVHAATVTAGDSELRRLKLPIWYSLPLRLYWGIREPRSTIILGQELSGEVEAVGKDVTRFRKGDQVFGTTGFSFGACAEYKCLSAENDEGVLALKPDNLTHEESAAVPVSGLEALHFIGQANIQPGEKVLIIGAGGSIGTFASQLAKYFGAEVTGVDRAEKLDMLRSIGADYVIDYTKENFAKRGELYDVIFDVVGKSSFSRIIRSLKPNGRYLLGNPRLSHMIRAGWTAMRGSKQVIMGTSNQRLEDLLFLKELIEVGKLKPVIDRCYPLEQLAEAHRYVDTGHKKGNVIITIAPE